MSRECFGFRKSDVGGGHRGARIIRRKMASRRLAPSEQHVNGAGVRAPIGAALDAVAEDQMTLIPEDA